MPPNPWHNPNNMEVIIIANVKLFNSLLNTLRNIPLNRSSSMIGDKITTVMKYKNRNSPLKELKSPNRGEPKLMTDNAAKYFKIK